MKRKIYAAILAVAFGAGSPGVFAAETLSAASASAIDSAQLEKALQNLAWPQFKSVVEAIPKLKADVDAYGPMGWQFVEANYRTYGWKKNIDKLDEEQQRQLAALIQSAQKSR